ncbi:MAG: hypothetical protein ACU836_05635 [Gammaproteobacteria bacterium]
MAIDHAKVLVLAAAGKWNEAHQMVQPGSDEMSCLIHAYLHRVEGDFGNARYWYGRAGQTMPMNSEEQEFKRLQAMLSDIA